MSSRSCWRTTASRTSTSTAATRCGSPTPTRPGKVRGRPIAATDEDLVHDRAEPRRLRGINPRPFTRAAPGAGPAAAGRVPAVGGDVGRRSGRRSSIRRNRYPQMFLATLVELGTIDDQLAVFLQAAVPARLNIMIAGATGAGKTTLLRALINCIPPAERLITVERSLELGLRRHPELHPDVRGVEEVLPDAEGNGGLTHPATWCAAPAGTTRRGDRRRGHGARGGRDAVSAMCQGNNGSLVTLHAQCAARRVRQAQHLRRAVRALSPRRVHPLIAAAVDFVVFIRQEPPAGRRGVVRGGGAGGGRHGRRAGSRPARIFAPSPVDGRAVRDRDADRRGVEELAEAGYDDTDVAAPTSIGRR